MATRERTVDWGGMCVIVDEIRLAAKPGLYGSATTLSSTEAAVLDGVTAGTATASKALVVDADKNLATLGTVAMTALTATTGTFSGAITGLRTVVPDTAFASPTVLTAAQSGALCVFDNTAGSVFTLPAAAAGIWFDFVIAVGSTSNAARVECASGDFIVGSIMTHATDDTGLSAAFAFNGTTHLAIQLDSDVTGRLAGGKFRLTAISATQWVISGDLLGTGALATPVETA
jgi:hypothetical protein